MIVDVYDYPMLTWYNYTVNVEFEDGSNGEFQELNLNAYDLSEVVVTVAMDNVDLTKVGRYETVATAEDEYVNKTKKEITIVVKERTTEE